MHKKDWVLFIATFIMGVMTGLYLYFTTFVPAYVANPEVVQIFEEVRSDLQITAEVYGGCDRLGCPSFSITGDRQYRYSAGYVRNTAENIENGDIPRSLFKKIEAAVSEADLEEMSAPANKQCSSFVDGRDTRYVIVFEGKTYELDTCTTRFSINSSLGQWLGELEMFMNDPSEYELPDGDERGGVGGIIEQRLQDSFPTTN